MNTNGPCVRRPSLCLVAHLAYGALRGGRVGHIGGVEWQTSSMAKWLAARAYRVSMLTWDEGQGDEVVVDGVRVIKMCRREAGLPGVRFFHPRWTSLNRALRRADADVYYHNCGEYVTGQVAWWCRRNHRGFVYSVASDPDCHPQLPMMKTLRERLLYRYGLRHADRVIVQTQRQARLLRDGFSRGSIVIPMPCPGPETRAYVEPDPPANGSRPVLWIARVSEPKRPDRLLDLAEACPDLRFDLVGPAGDNAYARRVCERAARIRNVTMHGAVPRDRVAEYYRRAACLCCTSDVEGFPNTFLEAWSHGIPVVSTFDPDGLIAGKKLGVAAQNLPGLIKGLRTLLNAPRKWHQISQNARTYYLEHHSVDEVMPRFERLFQELASDVLVRSRLRA